MAEPLTRPSIATSAQAAAPRVIASGVNYAFDIETAPKQVLFDVDFTLAAGEFVILTGPSGAGKTTLLTLIGALRAPQGGRLQVFGRDMRTLSPAGQRDIRRQIGFIFQDHNLFEALTVGQTLGLAMHVGGPALAKSDADARMRRLLGALGLTDYVERKPRALSGGQKQRVAVARALINDPLLVLADEPTAALDTENAIQVLDLLKERTQSDGASVILVTHDSRTFHAADRIVTMIDGRMTST